MWIKYKTQKAWKLLKEINDFTRILALAQIRVVNWKYQIFHIFFILIDFRLFFSFAICTYPSAVVA